MSYFAFRVPPQREAAADEILRKRGFAAFWPHQIHERRQNRHARHKTVEKRVPIVHGMIWAAHDGTADWWQRIHQIALIGCPFGIAGKARPFTEAEMDRMAALSGCRVECERAKRLSKGAVVRVTDGLWADTVHTVTAFTVANKRQLAKLGIVLMGVELEFDGRHLEVMKEAA